MIYCVRLDAFLAFLKNEGFAHVGQTKDDLLFTRGNEIVTVRRTAGNLTLLETDTICNAAGLTPPIFDTFWCD